VKRGKKKDVQTENRKKKKKKNRSNGKDCQREGVCAGEKWTAMKHAPTRASPKGKALGCGNKKKRQESR